MQFVLDLLLQLLVIDVNLLVQVEPSHIRGHSTVSNLLDQVFDLREEILDVVSLSDLVSLVLLLTLVVHLQVLLSCINQVELNVKVEVVQVILL